MKTKVKKICVTLAIIVLISIGLYIWYMSNKQTTKETISIKNTEFLAQDLELYKNLKEEVSSEENSQYDSIDTNNIILMEYYGNKDSVIIPEEINGKAVTKIEPNAFLISTNLEMIKIPKKILSIIFSLYISF